MCQFLDKTDIFLLFWPKFAQKLILGSEFQKFKSGFGIAPPRYHECQFSVKTDNFEFFGLNLGKLHDCMRYFSSNNLQSVAESWVEVEMSYVEGDGAGWRFGWSWLELGAQFSNNRLKKLLKYQMLL